MMLRNVSRGLPRQLRQAGQTTRSSISSSRATTAGRLAYTPLRMASSSSSSSSHLPPVQPPVSTEFPGDSFQLLSTADKAGAAEDALFEQQVNAVNEWWATERYEGIKRPYSAEDVVSKRGALQQSYPSSLMARKLFNLLNEKAKAGEPLHTRMLAGYIY